MLDLAVNDKSCKVLKDSGATIGVIYSWYAFKEHKIEKCVWVCQVVDDNSACLPVVEVVVKGSFGEVSIEAAVSPSLPPQYPYLL